MKKIFIRIIEIVVFVLLVLFVINKASLFYTVYGKDLTDPDRSTRLFYELPKDSVDVIFLGDSHSYNSYVPSRIYKKAGVTSASLATSSSSIINQYWQLKEALKSQKPKIVVLEAHVMKSIYDEDTRNGAMHITSGLYMMPDLSINKYKCLYDMKVNDYGCSNSIDYKDMNSLLLFKSDKDRDASNIDDIENFLFASNKYFETFGYFPSSEIHPLYKISQGETETHIDLQKTLEFTYLEKIYELCKKNNIEFVISMAPFYNTKETGRIYTQMFNWAHINKIKAINYFDLVEEIGLDLILDFQDSRHLNYYGAKKVTDYFVEFIEQYNLIDHRGDEEYSLWENMNYDYDRLKEELKIAEKELEY